MRKTIGLITATAIPALVALAVMPAALASTMVPKPLGASSLVVAVKDGCGKGFYRNHHGHCRQVFHEPERDSGTSNAPAQRSVSPGTDENSGSAGGGTGGGHGGTR